MTAQEALERWEVHGEGSHIPSIYREMGLTRLQPRPFHPKKDEAAQATFKKTSRAW